jgi:hypothetical protein
VTTRHAAILARASLATLVRSVPVRVLDISRCGCRLESTRWLMAGTIGQLRLCLDGREHEDDVRIARCQTRRGAGRSYLLGAELLGTRRLYAHSVRVAIERLLTDLETSEHPPFNTFRTLPDRKSEQQAKGVSRAPPVPVDTET